MLSIPNRETYLLASGLKPIYVGGFSSVPEMLCLPNAKLGGKGKNNHYKNQAAAGFLNITKQNK